MPPAFLPAHPVNLMDSFSVPTGESRVGATACKQASCHHPGRGAVRCGLKCGTHARVCYTHNLCTHKCTHMHKHGHNSMRASAHAREHEHACHDHTPPHRHAAAAHDGAHHQLLRAPHQLLCCMPHTTCCVPHTPCSAASCPRYLPAPPPAVNPGSWSAQRATCHGTHANPQGTSGYIAEVGGKGVKPKKHIYIVIIKKGHSLRRAYIYIYPSHYL